MPGWACLADDQEQRVIEREEEEKLAAEQAVWEAAERARFQEEERQAEEDRQRTLRESAAQAKEAASSRGGTARGRGGTRGLSRGKSFPECKTNLQAQGYHPERREQRGYGNLQQVWEGNMPMSRVQATARLRKRQHRWIIAPC